MNAANSTLTLQDPVLNFDDYLDDSLKQLPSIDKIQGEASINGTQGFFRCYVTKCRESTPQHEDMILHYEGLKTNNIYSWITKCGFLVLPEFKTHEPTVRELFEDHIYPQYVTPIAYLVTYFYGDKI